MLGAFPELLPDELLYSGFARYQEMFNCSTESLKRNLFGTNKVTAVIDLPGYLGAFVERLPSDSYSVDDLIRHHTMLPYHEPFIPASRTILAREALRDGHTRGVHLLLSAVHSNLPNPPFLRFCESCASDDLSTYGVSYWHRTHQAPGVLVCPIHETALFNSVVERRLRSDRSTHHTLSEEVVATGHPVSLPEEGEKHLLQVAENTSFVLNEGAVVGGPQRLHVRYRHFQHLRGWVDKSGCLQAQGLENAFVEHYGEAFLEVLGTPVPNAGTGDSWVARLLQLPNRPHPPLRHFLIMSFLGYSSADVYTELPEVGKDELYSDDLPLGMSDMVHSSPCRNPFCNEYDEEKVRTASAPEGSPRTVAVECPECRFSYDFDANCPRIYAIRSVGPLWEEQVRRIIAEGSKTKCEVAEVLKISPDTLDRVLKRSNITAPDWDGPNKGVGWSDEARQLRFEKRQQECRAKFQEVQEAHPTFSRNELQQVTSSAYTWLLKHDRSWFELRLPPKKVRHVRRDWPTTDMQLAAQVAQIAHEIRTQPGRPKRITRAAIWAKFDPPVYAYRRQSQLPKTWAAASAAMETREEWHSRRCAWIADQYVEEGVVPTIREFVSRAGLRNVGEARLFLDIDAYLRFINAKVSS